MNKSTFTIPLLTATLLLTGGCKSPTESEYISQNEAKEIVIAEILKGDTTSIDWAKITQEMLPPNTIIVEPEPSIITPDYKTWAVLIADDCGVYPAKLRWVIINAKSGEYYIEDHWLFRVMLNLVYFIH